MKFLFFMNFYEEEKKLLNLQSWGQYLVNFERVFLFFCPSDGLSQEQSDVNFLFIYYLIIFLFICLVIYLLFIIYHNIIAKWYN